MRHPIAYLTILGILFSASCGSQNETTEAEKINAVLVRTADELNQRLPDMVDENTVLEATSGSNLHFTYFYTLLNYSINDIDVDAFVTRMKPNLVDGACESSILKEFINKGVSIRYIYSDKDRQEFTSITVNPAECN